MPVLNEPLESVEKIILSKRGKGVRRLNALLLTFRGVHEAFTSNGELDEWERQTLQALAETLVTQARRLAGTKPADWQVPSPQTSGD